MDSIDTRRRAVVAAVLGLSVGGGFLSPASGYLDRFAPFSGDAWSAATRDVPDQVESPHGPATVRYDDHGVPHVSAADDAALYFAAGYLQATDRLFQMDLQRRAMRGELSAVFGDRTVESDVFHAKMDFSAAAEATWRHLQGSETGDLLVAFADGVNACVDDAALPLEFELLDYAPDEWTPVDTLLMEKQISWGLTGSFETLRRDAVRDAFDADAFAELFPRYLDHDTPIIRSDADHPGDVLDPGDGDAAGVSPALVDWLGQFESPRGVGSNSWVVAGEHTDSGSPIVANDPHLTLSVPPLWYEMHLRTADVDVRGVTFPGVPFVIIGENHAGAWGFTNTGADVIDFYRYETRDGQYRYRDEWRDYDEETVTVAVAGGEDRQVTVRKTVHGPVVEREGQQVAVAWTGLTATETTEAIHGYSHSDGLDEFLDATRQFDLPTQNVVYGDRDGDTLYYVTGRIPRRTVDGDPVSGDRVFDGSAGEAEWDGFEPYGISTWDGFIPFEEKPHVVNPEYIATANQRVVDGYDQYIGVTFAAPFRGQRIYDRLDDAVAAGTPIDVAYVQEMQRDTHDGRADWLVPVIVDAARGEGYEETVAALEDWDHRMDRDSEAALVFARWFDHYREALFADAFEAAGLGPEYYPNDWVVATLDADSPWLQRVTGRDSWDALVRRALDDALAEVEDEGWTTYGDYNVVALTHPFDLGFLNYPSLPTDGSPYTVKNFRKESTVGSSWRMVCPMDDRTSEAVLPGGNSGDYFSAEYDDQLSLWSDGRYRSMAREMAGDADVTFTEGGDA